VAVSVPLVLKVGVGMKHNTMMRVMKTIMNVEPVKVKWRNCCSSSVDWVAGMYRCWDIYMGVCTIQQMWLVGDESGALFGLSVGLAKWSFECGIWCERMW